MSRKGGTHEPGYGGKASFPKEQRIVINAPEELGNTLVVVGGAR